MRRGGPGLEGVGVRGGHQAGLGGEREDLPLAREHRQPLPAGGNWAGRDTR
jgi:hypothetical protein